MIEFSTLPNECSYLKDRFSIMQYKYIENCSSLLNDELVQRGWRRFGRYYSRPQCKECHECKSLRIDTKIFSFSKNAKRTFKKNKNTLFTVQEPTITSEHISLYEKYHKHMQDKKGWKNYKITPNNYHELYVAGAEKFGKEILYYIDNKLVGVDLVDFLDDGISSIYFFYDPNFADFSLGRYSIYMQIQLAKNFGLRWIYLGYYVKNCPSLNYKDRYRPYETMRNNATLDEVADWEIELE
ncbi:MAG: arginyltransferase [Epsilonproteobacteria bacterium]|nr:arginyltransferase [Campylobacterota bacterium]